MIAKLRITTGVQQGKTVLKECFYTPPFKVLDITEDRQDSTLHLMLMNASPGVLDGDQYDINISIAARSSVQLHTQSYQRLFRMEHGALQRMAIHLEAGSSFCYVPHPTVPHEASHFTSKTKFYLSKGCTLLWGDILTCGRKGSGEQFTFSKYHSVTEFLLNGQLIVKENMLLQPAQFDSTALGQLENFTHQASLIYLNEDAAMQELMDKLHNMLLLQNDICFGITTLPVNGLMVRVLGYKGEQLYGLLKKCATELTIKTTIQKQPALINTQYAI